MDDNRDEMVQMSAKEHRHLTFLMRVEVADYPQIFFESADYILYVRGYRRFMIGSHLALYLTDEDKKTVTIIRAIHHSL
jgi:plasmid stabilization system protein ParE